MFFARRKFFLSNQIIELVLFRMFYLESFLLFTFYLCLLILFLSTLLRWNSKSRIRKAIHKRQDKFVINLKVIIDKSTFLQYLESQTISYTYKRVSSLNEHFWDFWLKVLFCFLLCSIKIWFSYYNIVFAYFVRFASALLYNFVYFIEFVYIF